MTEGPTSPRPATPATPTTPAITPTTPWPHALDRTLLIQAQRATVFSYFTDSSRWAAWWGAGSTIDARPGGRMTIRYPNAVEAGGEVLEVDPERRIVFTFGFVSGEPMPVGASRVTIELADEQGSTRLRLRHEFAERDARDQHVQGWRYHLSVFANVVADAVHAGAVRTVDAWFACWSDSENTRRASRLAELAAGRIRFRDRLSSIEGLDELTAHLDAVHRFLPGSRVERHGEVRHCQGTVLADWLGSGADGTPSSAGTSVFTLDAAGGITEVIGVWTTNPA